MTESAAYLRRMQQSLTLLYSSELKAGTLPPQVKSLMANLSAELHARRLAGKAEDDHTQIGAGPKHPDAVRAPRCHG